MSDTAGGAPLSLRAHPSLSWRLYEDGLVVHVGETSETHCLPVSLAVLVTQPCRVTPLMEGYDALELEADGSYRAPAHVVDELLHLQILVRH